MTDLLVSQVKSQQAEVIRILDSKGIKYELIDISVGGAVRDEMRNKSGNPTAIPPQIFNEDQYCGVRRTGSGVFYGLNIGLFRNSSLKKKVKILLFSSPSFQTLMAFFCGSEVHL